MKGTSGVAAMIDREGRLEIAVGHGEVVTVESGEVVYQREPDLPDRHHAGSRDPGGEDPEQLPPDDEQEVERVPDSGPADADDEGHMSPSTPEADD